MATRQKVTYWGLSFLLGIFAASSGWNFYLTSLVFLIGLFTLRGFFKINIGENSKHPRILPSAGMFFVGSVVFLILGFFYFYFFFNFTNRAENIPISEKSIVIGVLTKNPEEKETYQKLTVELQAPEHGRITVLTDALIRFDYGDIVKLDGKIEKSQFKNQPPISFFPKIEVQAKNQGHWLKTQLYGLKNHLIGQFKKQLSRDKAALVAGITFGEKSEFTEKLKTDMARSGVTHIVALSGYNIAILALAIERSLKKLVSRQKRFYITLGLIFLFVIMVGGEASVVRAAIMGSLILLAGHIGRVHDTLHIIILTALVMVLVNPGVLAFDIGFQLSFLSLLGIVYLEPVLKKLLRVKDKKEESFLAWQENGVTTVAAQLAVIPILILNFNQFSLSAIFANTFILLTIPFTMFLGFLLSALSSISFLLGFFVAQLLSLLAFYQLAVIKIFSLIYLPLPGSQFLNHSIVFIIYYGFLLALVLKNHEKS
ncbi:MAG: competence protein ComEC [Parcubacteria group bacterium Gr01-1014_20]|nr:MAG: competence protein ComEC [Parcubacteria group bacterium Gr01-1014_20]